MIASWRRSAAYRIAFANFLAFAAGLALLGIVVFAAMHLAFVGQLDATISDEARTLVDEYRSGGFGELREAIAVREASHSPTRMLYAVFAPNGRRMAGSLNTRRPSLGVHDIVFIDPREGPDSGRGIAIDLAANERLLVAADREWVEQVDRTVVTVFTIAFLVACIAAFAGALAFGSYLRRRLNSISATARVIIAGDIRERMPLSGRGDEFDQLSKALNRMLDRIEGLVENLRQVSSDVAHDLRTPLSRLRTRLEQALSKRHGVRAADAAIEDAVHRIDEVLSLFSAILRIAELEAGQTRRLFAAVDLSSLITELAESFAPAFEDEGQTLFWSIEESLWLEGDRELLAQALINLLENAQRHTSKGSIVRLTLISADRMICVRVLDNGAGVPNADLGRITKKFTRLESARSTEGYGLGLSFVTAVAKLHGGRLILANGKPGLSATIELPRSGEPGHTTNEESEA